MFRIMKFTVICLAFLANVILAEVNDDAAKQNEQSLNTAQSTSKFLETLQGKLKLTVSEEDVPSVRQGEIILKQMCDRNGDAGSYENAQKAVNEIKRCFNDSVGLSELPSLIEKARPQGNLDQVFKDYCRRTDQFKECVQDFLIQIDPCLANEQKSSKYSITNITESILTFACENEGDYIALFISEKGPQCITEKQPGIERCIRSGLNETRGLELYEKGMNNTNNYSELGRVGQENETAFTFAFPLEQCKSAYKVRNCIIDELKTCSGSTPANVVESIFNLVQKSTTCSKYTRAELDPSYNAGATSLLISISSIIIPAVTILFARIFNS